MPRKFNHRDDGHGLQINRPIMKTFVILLLLAGSLQNSFSQSAKTVAIHFKLDLSNEIKNVKSLSSIGIRGNIAPLSWNKSYSLQDDDKDGIYEATINFETTTPTLRIKYKYFHDTASWEQCDDRILS